MEDVMKKLLNAVIAESGIWEGRRQETHGFLLSPEVFALTQGQSRELEKLGYALHDCLLGLSQIATIVDSNNYHGAWNMLRKSFLAGVPVVYKKLQGLNPGHIPRLLKVDIMLDVEGNFKIAEIDGHNKHGLGYSTLGRRFALALKPDALHLNGSVYELSREIKRRGYSHLKFLYTDRERFYVPEFEIAVQELSKYGITCFLFSDLSAQINDLQDGLFLDLPFPCMNLVYENMIPAYQRGDLDFIITPKPFLGSKGLLAILRNDHQDEQLESILKAFIRIDSLKLLRKYIPETYFFDKRSIQKIDLVNSNKYMLKEVVSSGMKGVLFKGDTAFQRILARNKNTSNWVIQEEVQNQAKTFSWYNRSGELCSADDYHMRLTAHYVNRNLAEVTVTACRSKSVHGGKNCIQMGTIIV